VNGKCTVAVGCYPPGQDCESFAECCSGVCAPVPAPGATRGSCL
jgi:hypothetical protein